MYHSIHNKHVHNSTSLWFVSFPSDYVSALQATFENCAPKWLSLSGKERIEVFFLVCTELQNYGVNCLGPTLSKLNLGLFLMMVLYPVLGHRY